MSFVLEDGLRQFPWSLATRFPKLDYLHITWTGNHSEWAPDRLADLTNLRRLSLLSMSGPETMEAIMSHPNGPSNITELDMESPGAMNDAILARLCRLESLNTRDLHYVTNAGLASRANTLTSLALRGFHREWGMTASILSSLTRLRSLCITTSSNQRECFGEYIRKLTQLTHLSLTNPLLLFDGAVGLSFLPALAQSLVSLELRFELPENWNESVARLTRLTRLRLYYEPMDGSHVMTPPAPIITLPWTLSSLELDGDFHVSRQVIHGLPNLHALILHRSGQPDRFGTLTELRSHLPKLVLYKDHQPVAVEATPTPSW